MTIVGFGVAPTGLAEVLDRGAADQWLAGSDDYGAQKRKRPRHRDLLLG